MVAVTGGGAYALSDLEIEPGEDQNGGWAWDAGLRVGRGRGSLGVGYERMRLDLRADGKSTTSAIYLEPRFTLGMPTGGVQPYLFAHGARIFDYDVRLCCRLNNATSSGDGWMVGGGFGLITRPVGTVRFDLSAGVHRLSGESEDNTGFGPWKGAGPIIDVRLGASVPLTRGSGMR